jgi:two-component system, NtrC family, nitrogen regulation sensor histidine kinase NtrY
MSKQRQAPSNFSLFIIGSLMLAFLTTLIFLQTSNVWKDFSIQSTTDTLTLYALSTLNFVAFVIFSFILIRNIVKLARERKSFQLGAKIKTRLLLYFIGLSFLPILAMASFSYLFMNRAIERWISQIPENVVREAKIVQDSRQTEMALMLANLLEKQEVTGEMLTNLAKKGNLIFIQILSAKDEVLVHSEKPNDDFLQIELEQRLQTSNIISADFSDGRRLIIVPDLRPEAKFNQTKDESLREFDRLKDRQNVIRQMGLTTLGLLTLLLIFASSWVAFYIARGLTAPIKAIAEGANEIAQGNFSHRVDVLAEDELSLLVDAFNQMSGKLEENSTELKERRRYIETVLQSLSTGVISFDATDRVTTINKAAIRMLKLEDADFKHFVLSQLVGKENQTILEKLINRAKRIGQAAEQTVLIREHADGSTETGESLPVALTATALPDKNGVVLVIEDLTELITAQRASAWQEVARRMAHEIKNPLTPIQLSAERIAKRFDLETKRQSDEATKDQKPKTENQLEKVINESTSTIITEVASLKSMVDEFSRFARLPNVKLESGNLNNLIAQTVALYEDRGVKIETNLAKNLPNVLFDEEQLKRVFVNLIENAIEAFDSLQTDKMISINTLHDSARDLIITEIIDNGNGISPSNFQKLFQPYFSTKGRGTGLGLAIVQRIITEHNSKIRGSNNSPKGAKFVIEFPVSNH